MAYTGTGTEADPYVVTNLTDFITCVDKGESYVKVGADIDAKDDENYTGELTDAIHFKCAKLYADSPKTIRGVTVYSNDFLRLYNGQGYIRLIENLNFLDCTHKLVPGNKSHFIYIGTSTASYVEIKKCHFSVRIVHEKTTDLNYRIGGDYDYFTNCALNIDFNDNMLNIGTEYAVERASNCNFIIRNLKEAFPYFDYIRHSSVIMENFSTSRILLPLAYLSEYSYFAFVNSKFSQGGSTTGMALSNKDHGPTLITCEKPSGDYNIAVPLIEITPEQLRDKEYLTSIGFLP